MHNTFAATPFISMKRYPILKWQLNLKIIWLASIASVVLLLTFYVVQVNALIRETYLMQGYQKKLSELSQENKILEINFSQANSLTNITDLVKNLNFEKIDKIHYIQVLEGQVVSK